MCLKLPKPYPFQPETVAFYAGRIILKRINELLNQGAEFEIELKKITVIDMPEYGSTQITWLLFKHQSGSIPYLFSQPTQVNTQRTNYSFNNKSISYFTLAMSANCVAL